MDNLIKITEKAVNPELREDMNIVIVGHVDHGKSTVIGRLLADNNMLPQGKIEQIKEKCRRNSKPFEYAFLLDALKDEQAQGITIDAARVFFSTQRRNYIILDAPGHVEFLKNMVTGASRAEAALMVIDANEGITEQDGKIAGEAHEAGKGIIIAVNKWDEYEKDNNTVEKYKKEIYEKLPYLSYAPIIFISAKTGQRVNKLYELINNVANQNAMRIPTSVLNQVLNEAIAIVQPPTDKGKRLKIFYMTQASTKPPTFVVFVNDKQLFHFSYERYLINQLRKEFVLTGTPIRMIVREKKDV